MAGKKNRRRKKKSQKDKEILYSSNVIDIDQKREARRRELSRKASAKRRKKGVKSLSEQMLDEVELQEHPEEAQAEEAVRPRARKKKSPLKLIIIAVLIVVLLELVFSFRSIVPLVQQKHEAQQEVASLKAQKTDLEKKVNELDSSEYIEQQARNWLKMARQGDMVYIMNGESGRSDSDVTQEQEEADASRNQQDGDENAL